MKNHTETEREEHVRKLKIARRLFSGEFDGMTGKQIRELIEKEEKETLRKEVKT